METTTIENVIFFKDLVFSALRRWRAMIVAALILGLVLAGYKGITVLRNASQAENAVDSQSQYEMVMQEYNSAFAKQEMLIDKLQQKLDEQYSYVENSLLMNIDPYSYYETQLILYVSTDYQIQPGMAYQDPDNTPKVLVAYKTMLNTPQVKEALAKTAGVEEQYLGELFSVSVDAVSSQITIAVIHSDEAIATLLQEQLTAIVENIGQKISKTICVHNATPLENNVSLITTGALAENQTTVLSNISILRSEIESAQTALEAMTPPAAIISHSRAVFNIGLFAVIGCVLGALLIIAWSCINHLTNQSIYSVKALVSRTGIKILGTIAQKKADNKIDRWLSQLEGRQSDDPQRRTALLVQDVAIRCAQADVLLVCSCGDVRMQTVFANELQKAMPQKKVLCCGSILNDAEAVRALADADAVLLVEQCGISSYPGVAEECRLINDYGKQLLGCILIGG